MKQTTLLKRTLVLGVVWCVGAVQFLQNKPYTPIFWAFLVLGMAECVFSIRYPNKYTRWLKIILALQAAYYLGVSVWAVLSPIQMVWKVGICLLAACNIGLIWSVFDTFRKEKEKTI